MRSLIYILLICSVTNSFGQMQVKGLYINSDSALFYISVPSATSVDINVWGLSEKVSDTISLDQYDDNTWLTNIKVPTGFYYYEFLVDGTPIFDRYASVAYREKDRWMNALLVSNNIDSFDVRKKGPFGNINICNYKSNVTGKWRQAMVYTPAGYDLSNEKYPVVYLLNNKSEDNTAWVYQGVMNDILDNAIAQDSATPMIIVAENINQDENLFDSVLVYDLIPYIDSVFNTFHSSQHRTIAGCEYGSAKAIEIFKKQNTVFNNLGVFSLPEGYNFNMALPSDFTSLERSVIYVSSGESDPNYSEMLQWHNDLNSSGIGHVWYSGTGNYNWLVWRRSLEGLINHLSE